MSNCGYITFFFSERLYFRNEKLVHSFIHQPVISLIASMWIIIRGFFIYFIFFYKNQQISFQPFDWCSFRVSKVYHSMSGLQLFRSVLAAGLVIICRDVLHYVNHTVIRDDSGSWVAGDPLHLNRVF